VLASIALASRIIVETYSLDGIRCTTAAWRFTTLTISSASFTVERQLTAPGHSPVRPGGASGEHPPVFVGNPGLATPEQVVIVQLRMADPCRAVLLDYCWPFS